MFCLSQTVIHLTIIGLSNIIDITIHCNSYVLSISWYLTAQLPYSGFCLWGPNLCKLCKMHKIAHFNSTVTFNSAIVLGMSQPCAVLYLMWSKCRYLVSRRPFTLTEQLRILPIVTTVQHFNQYSVIKLYCHPCEGVIISS